MPLSSILCSWIQLTERNKTWKFEENRLRKLNDTQPSKTMVSSSLFPSSRLISSSKTMILSSEYHYSFEIDTHELNRLLLRTLNFMSVRARIRSTRSYWEFLTSCLWEHAFAQLALTSNNQLCFRSNMLALNSLFLKNSNLKSWLNIESLSFHYLIFIS